MTSAAGVRYGVGKLRLSRFQKCAVRRLPSRKFSSILQFQANIRYCTVRRRTRVRAGEQLVCLKLLQYYRRFGSKWRIDC